MANATTWDDFEKYKLQLGPNFRDEKEGGLEQLSLQGGVDAYKTDNSVDASSLSSSGPGTGDTVMGAGAATGNPYIAAAGLGLKVMEGDQERRQKDREMNYMAQADYKNQQINTAYSNAKLYQQLMGMS